jgi:26S proteasome regulatory subunit T2
MNVQSERAKVDDIRGTPLSVGTLEEMIDDNHAIVSSTHGPEYYVSVMSFVNQDLLEPGCSVLLHNKVTRFLVPPVLSCSVYSLLCLFC